MRKFISVCLWLGLFGCVMLLISQSGQRMRLTQERAEAVQRGDVLETMYAEEKARGAEQATAWAAEKEAWAAERAALEQEAQRLQAALTAAQRQAAQQIDVRLKAEKDRQALEKALTDLRAEKDAAERRLTEVMSILNPPTQEATGLIPEETPMAPGNWEGESGMEEAPVG